MVKTKIHKHTTGLSKYLVFLVLLLQTRLTTETEEEGEDGGLAIGIDLGTTYCAFSYFDPETGEVTMLADEHGDEVIPSVLFYNKKEGKMLVGSEAKNVLGDAGNKIWDAKRVIGRKFSDPVVKRDLERWPFKVEAGKDDVPVFVPDLAPAEMQVFKQRVNQAGSLRPEEVSAMLLRHLKRNAERVLGRPVTKAVITVPAYFNTSQRQATKDAGEMAGLRVLRVINEPTSAAIAFGLDEKKQGGSSLVFDLGGGTFDVSVVDIDEGFFDVKASNGDSHLGGQDFDKEIEEIVLRKTGAKRAELGLNEKNKLKLEAEAAKILLSKAPEAELQVSVKGSTRAVKITRVEFEKRLTKRVQKKLESTMEKALKGAGMQKGDIEHLVLIGGSTRIPAIQRIVEQYMGVKPYTKIDPDKAVAYGAGVQAAVLSGVKSEKFDEMVLLDVTPLDLGIETQGGVMAKLVKMNQKIPLTAKQTFSPASQAQDSVVIAIYQGPSTMVKKNIFLGKFVLNNIGKNFPEIEVEFEVDANGIVKVTAHEKGNNQKGEITLDKASTISEEEKERIIEEFRKNEKADKLEGDIVTKKQSIISGASRLAGDANASEELKAKVNEILNEVNMISEISEESLEKVKELEAKFTSIMQMAGGAQAGQEPGDEDGDEDDEDEDEDDEDL